MLSGTHSNIFYNPPDRPEPDSQIPLSPAAMHNENKARARLYTHGFIINKNPVTAFNFQRI